MPSKASPLGSKSGAQRSHDNCEAGPQAATDLGQIATTSNLVPAFKTSMSSASQHPQHSLGLIHPDQNTR